MVLRIRFPLQLATNGQKIGVTDENGAWLWCWVYQHGGRSPTSRNTRPTRHSYRETVRSAAASSDNTGASTAGGWLAQCGAARPVHGIELRDGRRWSRCNTGCRSATGRRWRSRTLEADIEPRRTQVSTETNSAAPADPGLECLVTLLHLQGVVAIGLHRLGTPIFAVPSRCLICSRSATTPCK